MLSSAARRNLCGLVAATLASACGGTTSEQVISPTLPRCEIVVTTPPPALPAVGSNVSLNVSAARDCAWTAASDAAWATVTPASGQGSGAVAVVVAANAQASSRSTAIAVNDARVTISQEAAPCRFELASQSARVGFEGGRTSAQVSTIDGCQWIAVGSTDWLRVLTERGAGSGDVEIDVSRNEGRERTVTLSIAGISFAVIQDAARGGGGNGGNGGNGGGGPGNPPPPPPSTCSFSIDPERTTVRAAAGPSSVRVITDPGCAWTAAPGVPWISVQRLAGAGPDALSYHVGANLSTVSERSGSIAIAGRTHNVTQDACNLTLESGSPNLPPSAGSYEFRVNTDSGCIWTARADVEWISVIHTIGSGGSSITYRVAPNPLPRDRSGTIVVSGRTKVITQQALGQS